MSFLKFGTVSYRLIKKINKELHVNARYCAQCIPKLSIPDLLNSDFVKILTKLYWSYKIFFLIDAGVS